MATEDLHIQDGLVIPGRELQVQASLSGGPGGQHVNNTHSRIPSLARGEQSSIVRDATTNPPRSIGNRITNAGFIVVHCGVHRQQLRNIQGARQQLKDLIRHGLHTQEKTGNASPPEHHSGNASMKKKRGQVKQHRRKPKLD